MNCFYNAQGSLVCSTSNLVIDTNGVADYKLNKYNITKLHWESPNKKDILGMNPQCYSELPCCKKDKNINQFCKPTFCCSEAYLNRNK